jgi:hypothetical protein
LIRARTLGAFMPLALATCGRSDPHATPEPPASSMPTAASVGALRGPAPPIPSAPVEQTKPAPSATAPDEGAHRAPDPTTAKEALDEATLDRAVFRHISTGMITHPTRVTWILLRSPTRVRLHVLCQPYVTERERVALGFTNEVSHRLNGSEGDERLWAPPILTTYAGSRKSEKPLSYLLTAAARSTKEDGCAKRPTEFVLSSCRQETVPVLAAGAVLRAPERRPDVPLSKGSWHPPRTQRVAGLRCDLAKDDGERGPFPGMWPDWSLVFAPRRGDAPGIEWAFENSTTTVQEGAYRFMPGPRSAPPAPPAPSPTSPPLPPSPAPKDALDEAFLERLVFRQIAVGTNEPPRRFTWVLLRDTARVRLHTFCQTGTTHRGEVGRRLQGSEIDEALWSPPVFTTYAGARTSEKPLSYRLAAVAGSTGKDGCGDAPGTLVLSCRDEMVPVLAAGAALLGPGRWKPPASQAVSALRCELAEDGADASRPRPFRLPSDWPLVFAPRRGDAPGIEWAHENSPPLAHEGAYRFISAPP